MKMTCNISLICSLKTRREALGWSLDKLGGRCGIDEAFLSDWEHGLGLPRVDEIQDWAAGLGLALELVPSAGECRQGLQVDWGRRCIKLDGEPIRLTPMEWKVLERLARTPGELVTQQALFRHLYGGEWQLRSQSTAVRVLIAKLRRMLPVRIEARWGQGYEISGLPPLPAQARNGNAAAADGAATSQPGVGEARHERVAFPPKTAPRDPPPTRRELVDRCASGPPRAASAPIHVAPRRAEELGVIERFLAERGVTRCPDVSTIQQSPLPTLIWNKATHKWVRPSIGVRRRVDGPPDA
jgi:transcriptional regulator with XRE-family HTH domain